MFFAKKIQRRHKNETHLSAEETSAQERTRLYEKNGYAKRTQNPLKPPRKGKKVAELLSLASNPKLKRLNFEHA